jgi:hypothetical protein
MSSCAIWLICMGCFNGYSSNNHNCSWVLWCAGYSLISSNPLSLSFPQGYSPELQGHLSLSVVPALQFKCTLCSWFWFYPWVPCPTAVGCMCKQAEDASRMVWKASRCCSRLWVLFANLQLFLLYPVASELTFICKCLLHGYKLMKYCGSC